MRWRDVILFVLLAFAISWPVWIGLQPLIAPLEVRTFLAQTGPLFAAIAVIHLRRGPLRHRRRVGWARIKRSIPESLFAVAVVAVPFACGVALSLASGDLKAHSVTDWGFFRLGPQLPLVLLTFWVSAYGEEYGWRGFLQPQLQNLGGLRVALVTAVIFSIWHVPAILLQGFDFPRHPLRGAGEILVFSIPFTIMLTWLRTLSSGGGVAGPAAAHATFNIAATGLLLWTSRSTNLIAAPVGLLGAVPFAVLAVWLVARGRLWPPGGGWSRPDPVPVDLEAAGIEPAC